MNLALPLPTQQYTLNLPALTNTAKPNLSSMDILCGQKSVDINHNGFTYKLQATRSGKLILTK